MGSKVQCLDCGVVLESKYRHDFQVCNCPNQTFVDGGVDYCRKGGVDLSRVKVIQAPEMKTRKQK